jgi:hypothetical protein
MAKCPLNHLGALFMTVSCHEWGGDGEKVSVAAHSCAKNAHEWGTQRSSCTCRPPPNPRLLYNSHAGVMCHPYFRCEAACSFSTSAQRPDEGHRRSKVGEITVCERTTCLQQCEREDIRGQHSPRQGASLTRRLGSSEEGRETIKVTRCISLDSDLNTDEWANKAYKQSRVLRLSQL